MTGKIPSGRSMNRFSAITIWPGSGLENRLLGDEKERLSVTLGSDEYRALVMLRREIRLYRAGLVNERMPVMVVRHLRQRIGLDPPRSPDGLAFRTSAHTSQLSARPSS